MIFALFCLQSISFVFGINTRTKIYDIETVINSYLSNTIDQHALHATSSDYMKMIQQESNLSTRYLQSVRYILHGFPITIANETKDNINGRFVYKKLNFIQSIALFYCGINMSQVIKTSFENIAINESQLYMNSTIFPIQVVESYELVRSEICQRIKLGLHRFVVDMFKTEPYSFPDFFFSGFIEEVALFVSTPFKTGIITVWEKVGQMYPFLSRFGELELYKGPLIQRIWDMDRAGRKSKRLIAEQKFKFAVDTCVSEIKHPKMHKYVVEILKQQVETGTKKKKSSILNHRNVSMTELQYYVKMYQLVTLNTAINHQFENNTVEIRDLIQLLGQCQEATSTDSTVMDMNECVLITLKIYQSYYSHEYIVNTIKCTISDHHLYCSKFIQTLRKNGSQFWRYDLRNSIDEAVLYPYLNEIMNDTVFVNIVNNNTDSDINSYWQTMLSKLMSLALEEYRDIDMIKKIATVFTPTIDVREKCISASKNKRRSSLMSRSWMDVLKKHQCMYLTNYFQQRFRHQIVENCTQTPLLSFLYISESEFLKHLDYARKLPHSKTF